MGFQTIFNNSALILHFSRHISRQVAEQIKLELRVVQEPAVCDPTAVVPTAVPHQPPTIPRPSQPPVVLSPCRLWESFARWPAQSVSPRYVAVSFSLVGSILFLGGAGRRCGGGTCPAGGAGGHVDAQCKAGGAIALVVLFVSVVSW